MRMHKPAKVRWGIVLVLLGIASSGTAQEIGFADLRGVLALRVRDQEAVTRWLASALRGTDAAPEPLPAAVREDGEPRILFLSVSDGMSACRIARIEGRGLAQALERGAARLRKMAVGGSPIRWLKVDLVREADPLAGPPGEERTLDAGLDGLAFGAAAGPAFLPEELTAHGLLEEGGAFRTDAVAAWAKARAQDPEATAAACTATGWFRFRTLSWYADGREVVPLHRGHRMFPAVTPDQLLASARDGARYLARSVKPDGRFVYIYWPTTDSETRQYNIVRHAGTLYSMMEAVEATGDPLVLESARRALGYLRNAIRPLPPALGSGSGVVQETKGTLGAVALGAVAIAEYVRVTGDREPLPALIELGRAIQSLQAKDGEFGVHEWTVPGGEPLPVKCEYYPGEALLAMVRIHPLAPEDSWLDTAERAARWLIEVRDADPDPRRQEHDHWLLYGLDGLHRLRPRPAYLAHVRKIVGAILDAQHRRHDRADYVGGYYTIPNSTPVATRSEGLGAACRLLRDFGHPGEADAVLAAIDRGVRFSLQTQFLPERAMYFRDPPRILGGFHRHLENFEIRNDYVQHNLSAILGLWRLRRAGTAGADAGNGAGR